MDASRHFGDQRILSGYGLFHLVICEGLVEGDTEAAAISPDDMSRSLMLIKLKP